MINGPGKYSVKIATPGVTIRGRRAPPVRCMKALAEQISELDGIVIYGRVVGVRGLMVEVAGPLQHVGRRACRYRAPSTYSLQVVGFSGGTMPRCAPTRGCAARMPRGGHHGCRRGSLFGRLAGARCQRARRADLTARAPAARGPSGCTSRSKLFLPKVRKKQPAWRKDTVGWPKSWPPRKPNANVIAP